MKTLLQYCQTVNALIYSSSASLTEEKFGILHVNLRPLEER
uniref:Uncharacterized protein n=1 Tax=Arundo donax TaxID=35708 RepID=A0A0A9CIM4_ARUDO